MIPIQSSVHTFDEMLKMQKLADILLLGCKLYSFTLAVVLQHLHINKPYANMSCVRALCNSCVDIGLSVTL